MSNKIKRVMRKFQISEISAVDLPAMEGATALLMKSAGVSEVVRKAMRLLSDVDGHSHMILDDGEQGGMTTYGSKTDDVVGHCHPWVRDAAGGFTIGMADDHTHTVLSMDSVTKQNTLGKPDAPGETTKSATQGEAEMDPKEQEKLVADLAKANADLAAAKAEGDKAKADLAVAEKRAGMSDVEKSAAQDATNPVVFTAADGSAFRKNDDPRLVKLAKANDDLAKSARESSEREQDAILSKRADSDLKNLPGKSTAKVALLKAVGSIKDEALRAEVETIVKAAGSGLAGAFKSAGTTEGSATGRPTEQLEALAKSFSETKKVSIDQARVAVLDTPEGKALYAQTIGVGNGL